MFYTVVLLSEQLYCYRQLLKNLPHQTRLTSLQELGLVITVNAMKTKFCGIKASDECLLTALVL